MAENKTQHNEEMYLAALETACNTSRTAAMLRFVRKWTDGKMILDWGSNTHPAIEVSVIIRELMERISIEPSFRESGMMVALACSLLMSGTPLHTVAAELKKEKIALSRAEFAAMVAVNSDSRFTPKEQLIGNPLAVYAVCASRMMWTQRLHNPKAFPLTEGNANAVRNKLDGCWVQSQMESIEKILRTFVAALVGNDHVAKVDAFLKGLVNIGFYQAPASRKRLSCKGGLAVHVINVFCRLIDICSPETDAEVGKLILLAVCANLCRCMRYTATTGKKKVYTEDGTQTEPDGRKFNVVQVLKWELDEKLPFSDAEKSLYMALSYFDEGTLPDELVTAIAYGVSKEEENGCYALKDTILGCCLSVATTLATFIDEEGV